MFIMNPDNVCILCLNTEAPMRDITDSSLRSIYEKLTDIPLKTWDGPVAACYLCHSQLRNCHALMTRAMTAYILLTQIKLADGIINRKTIAMIDRQAHKLNDRRSITVSDFINITDPKQVQATSKDDALYQNMELESETLLDVINIKREMSEKSGREHSKTVQNIQYNKQNVLDDLKDGDNSIMPNRKDVVYEVTEREENFVDKGLTSRSNLEDTNIKCSEFERMRGADGSGRYNKLFTGNIKCEMSQSEDVDLTDDRVIDLEVTTDVADNEYDSLIDVEDMKIEYSTDGNSRTQQNKENTSDKATDTIIISKYNDDTIEYAKIAELVVKNECVDNDASHSDKKNDNDNKSSEIKILCDSCGAKIENKCYVIEHIQWDKIVKRHKATKRGMQIRKNLNKKDKDFKCSLSEIVLREKSEINLRKRTHTGERLECAICKMKFKLAWHLNTHMKSHNTVKRYFECATCQSRFKYKGNLIKHLTRHTGEKEFQCKICKWRFELKSKLTDHLKAHYRALKCECCPKTFNQSRGLNMHIKRYHTPKRTFKKSFECTNCQCTFERISDSSSYLRMQSSECPACEARFSIKKDLNKDVRTYTRKKTFECTICKQNFSDKDSLNVHLTTHKT